MKERGIDYLLAGWEFSSSTPSSGATPEAWKLYSRRAARRRDFVSNQLKKHLRMSDFFLGVDGGQSSTTALIGDETGRIGGLGYGWAMQSRFGRGGDGEVSASDRRVSFASAFHGGELPRDQRFRAACLGMSGGPEDKSALLGEMVAADRLTVTHDAEIALAGALNGGAGVIVIAGTGSIAFGTNAAGARRRGPAGGATFSAMKERVRYCATGAARDAARTRGMGTADGADARAA